MTCNNRLMRPFLTAPLLAAMICLLPLPVWADTIQIEAGKMTLFHKDSKVVFFNNVHLIRGKIQLDCDHMIAYYSKKHKLTHADADGHVVVVQGHMHGRANKARLDQVRGILTLSGQAVLEQMGSRVKGETIVYNLNTRNTVVTPVTGGRVRMTIESTGGTSVLPATGKK